MARAPKETLHGCLRDARDSLVWKTEGLSERELRLPRTPTGVSLLGIIKHVLNMEAIYFGATFGRPWPVPDDLVSAEVWDRDPQADWVVEADQTAEQVLDLFRRITVMADRTIDELDLDSVGHVPHWNGTEVTLHQMMTHVLMDHFRHAGQADVIRERIDGQVGMIRRSDNIPDLDWPVQVARVQAIADQFE